MTGTILTAAQPNITSVGTLSSVDIDGGNIDGVTIATLPSTKVRSVFEGEVMSVLTFKGSNPSVLIRHGNYITVYKNLGELYVKKGDKVKSKQVIGEVFTNQQTGKTEVQFSIFNNIKVLNPSGWINPVSYTHLTLPTIYSE